MTIKAGIVCEHDLIAQHAWEQKIDALKIGSPFTDKKEAISLLSKAFEHAVRSRIPKERFGILFSGGLDSTLIAYACKAAGEYPVLYTVATEKSKDAIEAKQAAALLGLTYRQIALDDERVNALIKKAANITRSDSVVTVSVAATELAGIEAAKEDGITILFGGLGAEEIFAGYERHGLATDINEECWRGLRAMWQHDLVRDFSIARDECVTLLTPFLDDELIALAMRVPGEWKIIGLTKKVILRDVALRLGIPAQFALRKKLAAQYGSGLDAAFERLARKAGTGKSGLLKGLSGTSSR